MSTSATNIEYRPGFLVRAMMIGHRLGLRYPRRFIAWAMQHSGHVRLGTGPWRSARPNLYLGRATK